MHDPREGVTPSGTITTGAHRDRVPQLYEPVLDAAVAAVGVADPDASLYVYGSVATGMAMPCVSDVDLLTIGLPAATAAEIARDLSARYSSRAREVAVAPAGRSDFVLDSDEGYGGLVFLKHYCVHLAGPDLRWGMADFPADARAARGFNGDIADHAARWRAALDDGADPEKLGRRLARKTLLAAAGLVSVHDRTWTTDRATAAVRWAEIEPALAYDLDALLAWSRREAKPDRASVRAALDGVVGAVVTSFETSIGLWASNRGPGG